LDIGISVAQGALADLESLDSWLRGEPELAGRVRIAGAPPRPGQLGALSETLLVAVGSGGAITVVGAALAAALKAWLSQPRRSDVHIRIHRLDGTTVEIDAERVGTGAIDVAATLSELLDPGTSAMPVGDAPQGRVYGTDKG
jgi:Effector Associated Constant Component 1